MSATPSSSSLSLSPNDRLLLAASHGDLPTIKSLLTNPDEAQQAQPWHESSDLGWSALHYAAEQGHTKVVEYLLRNGAVWNAVDIHGVTAAQVAWSCNFDQTYAAILQFGVGQTLLADALQVDEEEEEEEMEGEAQVQQDGNNLTLSAPSGELANSNLDFLASPLRFVVVEDADPKGKRRERCLDADDNMVMSGWEIDIMQKSAEALCQGRQGLRVLNIGYGLGIVDDFFQEFKPSRHVIIEPHPDVVKFFKTKSIANAQGVELVQKRWEDALADPELGEFDVVYADPFAQDYKDLKKLFDLLPNLLRGPDARFSFFHGLAGTNRFL